MTPALARMLAPAARADGKVSSIAAAARTPMTTTARRRSSEIWVRIRRACRLSSTSTS
jgi:hypothetical protein